MRYFWRYIFPVLFGFVIYASIRLVNDTTAREKFWERPWQTNAIELAGVVVISFVFIIAINRVIRHLNSRQVAVINTKVILKEFAVVLLVTIILIHLTVIPLIALTDDGLQLNDYVIATIISTLFIMLYFAIIRGNQYLKNYVTGKVLLEKISNSQLQTELKFLKSQYHPHFLFNALNTIYFQMDENVVEAKRTVEKFSELLRYQLYDHQQTVPISQEIQYLQNFIDIQKVRTSDRLQMTIQFDAALDSQQVYPLLFLPLVENAFKYVGGNYWITIDARTSGPEMEFTVVNSLPLQSIPEGMNGIGLENLKRRLALLYPDRHQLITRNQDNTFVAKLFLNLNE